MDPLPGNIGVRQDFRAVGGTGGFSPVKNPFCVDQHTGSVRFPTLPLLHAFPPFVPFFGIEITGIGLGRIKIIVDTGAVICR